MNLAVSKHRRTLGFTAAGEICSRLSVRGAIHVRHSGSVPRFAQRSGYTVAFFSAIFSVFVVASAFAQADFTKANQEYAQGHFQEAIAGYETLVRAGQWNANLFYDLGNAYFRTRDFGHAILNYERALALDQGHPEATANLQIARDESRALELQPTRLERYLQFASINQYQHRRGGCFVGGNFWNCRANFRASPIRCAIVIIDFVPAGVRSSCLGDLHARQRKQRTRSRRRHWQ